jgi:hypothetical protein
MTRFLKISALALALQPLTALAAPVTLQGMWACHPGNTCAFDGMGVLTFTYENTTPGAAGTYTNAVTSATMVFNNISLTFDSSAGSSIRIFQGMTSGSDGYIGFSMRDQANNLFTFRSWFEDYNRVNANTSLSSLEGLFANENATLLLPDGTSPNGPTGALYSLHQYVPLQAVPVPAAAWLFGSAVLGLAGVAQRKKA